MHRSKGIDPTWRPDHATPVSKGQKTVDKPWQRITSNPKPAFEWNNLQRRQIYLPGTINVFHGTVKGVNLENFWLLVCRFLGNTDLLYLRRLCKIFAQQYPKNWRRSLRIDLCPDGKEMLHALSTGQDPLNSRLDLLPTLLTASINRHSKLCGHAPPSAVSDSRLAVSDRPNISLRHLERFVLSPKDDILDLTGVKTCHISDGNSILSLNSLVKIVNNATKSSLDDLIDPLAKIVDDAMSTFAECPSISPVIFSSPVSPLTSTQIQKFCTLTNLRPKGLAAELTSSNAHLLVDFLNFVDKSLCEHLIVRLADRNFDVSQNARLGTLSQPISLATIPSTLRGMMLDIDSHRICHRDLGMDFVLQPVSYYWPDMAFIQIHIHVMHIEEFQRMRDFLVHLIRGSAKLRTLRVFFVGPTNFPISRPPAYEWMDQYQLSVQMLSEITPPYVQKSFSLLRVSFPERIASQTLDFLTHLHYRIICQMIEFNRLTSNRGQANGDDDSVGIWCPKLRKIPVAYKPSCSERVDMLRAILRATKPGKETKHIYINS
eukprot:GHVH01001233.1.p1 GENE.GHVH01001233.1~~GHVH01001233.1.p1  ORF type:complete len:545 (+),score=45.55 GHVH01001233.1:46-1680(+)